MLKQRQTIFGEGKGNCFSTCIASLFDLPIEEVPNFCLDAENWFENADAWTRARGFRLVDLRGVQEISIKEGTRFIASGKSPRGDFNHSLIATVNEKGEFVVEMDPHPSDANLDGPFMMMTFLVKA